MLRLATCGAITVVAAGAPWLLGGYSPWCYALAPVIALAAALLWLCAPLNLSISRWSWTTSGILVLLLIYVWLQVTPLPSLVLRSVTSASRITRIDQVLATNDQCARSPGFEEPQAWNRVSSDPTETKRQWSMLATAVALCMMAMILANDEWCRVLMVFLLAMNGAIFGIFAIYQRAAAPGTIYFSIKPKWQQWPFGAFVNRNHAGLFLAISGLLAFFGICLLASQRLAKRKHSSDRSSSFYQPPAISLTSLRMIWLSQKDPVLLTMGLCALFCAMSSIVAASRSGVIAFGAVVIVSAYMLYLSGADRRWLVVIGGLGGCGAILAGAKLTFLMSRFELDSVESGLTARLAHWSDVLDQSSEYFLTGVGYGSYSYSTLPYLSVSRHAWFQHADNQFVEGFVELGLVGGILVIASISLFFMRCVELFRSSKLQARIVGVFGIGLLAICTINALADFAIVMPGVMLPLAIAIGFVLGFRTTPNADRSPTWRAFATASLIKVLLIGILLWAAVIGLTNLVGNQSEIADGESALRAFARSVSTATGEANLRILVDDADHFLEQFVEEKSNIIRELDPEFTDEHLNSLEKLAMLKQASADDSDEKTRAMHEALSSDELLIRARENYLRVARLSPLRFDAHLALARLNLLLCPGNAVSTRIALVRRLTPSSVVDACKAGITCIVNGDFEQGGEYLRQAIQGDPLLEERIFAVLKLRMTVQDVIKYILKNDVHLLIAAADRYYNAQNEWGARSVIFSQLRAAIESGEIGKLSPAEAKYSLARAKWASGDFDGAIADLQAACEVDPAPIEWMRELVATLEQQARWRDAIKVLLRIREEYPFDPRVEKRIESIRRIQRAEERKAGP